MPEVEDCAQAAHVCFDAANVSMPHVHLCMSWRQATGDGEEQNSYKCAPALRATARMLRHDVPESHSHRVTTRPQRLGGSVAMHVSLAAALVLLRPHDGPAA